MILVDTSVWIEHLRVRHERLATALEDGEVAWDSGSDTSTFTCSFP